MGLARRCHAGVDDICGGAVLGENAEVWSQGTGSGHGVARVRIFHEDREVTQGASKT